MTAEALVIRMHKDRCKQLISMVVLNALLKRLHKNQLFKKHQLFRRVHKIRMAMRIQKRLQTRLKLFAPSCLARETLRLKFALTSLATIASPFKNKSAANII